MLTESLYIYITIIYVKFLFNYIFKKVINLKMVMMLNS